uniref:Uncharacterized protein n=1 Tax=Leptospira santarosai serovar Arenal str. MAVJ 401 TaxID=1049976 RepID=M6K5Z3_9LEPT|nr:hypothetical protein LEP1GSC063_2655 [Leptospira santarosai serovar Arenal str. MAVJ 401]
MEFFSWDHYPSMISKFFLCFENLLSDILTAFVFIHLTTAFGNSFHSLCFLLSSEFTSRFS